MPGLILFQRRWSAGSDDLVLPGIILCLTHFVLFLITCIFVISSSDLEYWSSFDPDFIAERNANQTSINLARCANELKVFTLFFVALLIVAMLIEAIMIGFSMQGTVLEPGYRKYVPFIIYVRSALGVFEVLFSIIVAVHLKNFWNICDPMHHLLGTEAVIITINFTLLLIVLLILACIFDSSGATFYRLQRAKSNPNLSPRVEEIMVELDEKVANSWKKSLRRCLCGVRDTSNTNVALEEASHLLRDLFKDLDVVPSDILAGLILLRHKQQCKQLKKVSGLGNDVKEYYTGRAVTKDLRYIDPQNPKEAKNLETLIYYCEYAVASYGSFFYCIYHPFSGLCNVMDQCLCQGRCCCVGPGPISPSARIEGEKCCKLETSAVVRYLNGKLKNAEIIYVSWKNDLYEQPFFITLDHDKHAVVVAIRGTLSELDALTDIVATPDVIPVPKNKGSWKCHKGILKGAIYLHDSLVRDGLLADAFSRVSHNNTEKYQLVLVGHSLGAGIASVLSILLRPIYPDLHCYSYSPPGGLLSQSAVDASRDYISSAVFGKDMVVRTSIHQLHRMKSDILKLLRESNRPKFKIVFGKRSCPPSKPVMVCNEGNTSVEENLIADNTEVVSKHEVLYPPGRIFHIVYKIHKKDKLCGCREEKSYYAIEADNFKDFDEILVSHNMVNHHWPQELLKAIKKVPSSRLPEGCRKYEDTSTMPSRARLPTNQEQDENIRNHAVSTQPDTISHTIIQTPNASVPNLPAENIEIEEAEIIQDTDHSLTSTHPAASYNLTSSDKSLNTNEHNNKHPSPEPSSPTVVDPPDNGSSSGQSLSLVGRFKTYMDAVLPEPSDVASNNQLSVNEPLSKQPRSQSMPPNISIDRNTIERAQFEPNLIPKPPRSNSMVKQRPTDPVVEETLPRSSVSRDDDAIDDAATS